MQKTFDPAEIEARWYPRWEASGAFAPSGDGAPYTILLPPPNVTGTLHMGHAFQHTLIDALVRYHRMRGARALWQLGSDHAGIATEMVVARQLAPSGETRDSLGREAFIERVWDWKAESGDTIERQMRRLGVSGDWTRRVFTMDPMPSKAVIEAFVRLYDDGLIYRGKRLVNWDPVLQTAISDLEVENVEEMGSLWSIRYPVVDPPAGAPDHLVVATTRPETMLGDVAVAVHPDDERYATLVGASLRLPLTGRLIPVIADDYVDREFGTGCVKITPAHDFNDFAIGERHGLAPLNILDAAANVVGDQAASDLGIPASLAGLDRYDARREVLEMLKSEGLLVETKPHRLQVPRGDRSGVVIEPWLTDQWFVRMDDMAKRGLALAESGAVRFVPGNWINTWRHFLENSQDWCISRQLWWGHRIPAWFDDAGGIHVGRDEAEARARSGLAPDVALHQDDDVLETWFSSALWPLSTLGWPDESAMAERGFAKHLPTSVLVTGFDILFFWVARMVMMTDQLLPDDVPDADRVPFRDVYITGLVRDRDGQKMSKSKGNILDPLDLIDGIGLEELVAKRTAGLMQPKMAAAIEQSTRREFPDGIPAFGTDALRFTFASLASHGRDIKFDLARCEGYKNFCNKLWNAARFVLMHADADESDSIAGRTELATLSLTNPLDAWLVGRLAATITEVEVEFAAYRFDLASQALYDFIWNDYCDWAIEFAKPRLAAGGDDAAAALQVLLVVLEAALRALHPLLPFLTEEIRQHLAPRLGIDPGLTPAATWPDITTLPAPAPAIVASVERLHAVVTAIRRIRSELQLAPKQPITLQWRSDDATAGRWLEEQTALLAALVRTDSVSRFAGAAGDEAAAAATAVVGQLELLVPLAGLVDENAERERLDRELTAISSEIAKSKAKLNNPSFVDRAPEAVVAQERARLADWTHQHDALTAQRAKFT